MADNDNTDTNTNTNTNAPISSAGNKKRTRVQFSCTACRYRKLKCDRTHPCDRCTRRGDAASCTYVGHGPRGRATYAATANPSHIQNRMQHLENLILSFAQQKRLQDGGSGSGTRGTVAGDMAGADFAEPGGGDPSARRDSSSAAITITPPLEDSTGKMVNHQDLGTTYVDSSHWRAILDDINEVKRYLRDDDATSEDDFHEEADEIHDSSRPALLFYSGRVLSQEELIADLPERTLSDRLVSRFLNSGDPSLVILHFPTFQREYANFWADPQSVPLAWLGLLYACLTMAVNMYRRSLEPLPGSMGDPIDVINRLQRNCCHCLINSNYTKVGKYKVEAMMLYTTTEYSKKGNAPVSSSIILGMIVKLAMRMGYHRDAKHYNNISALEGEMRRRTWAVIAQLDALTAFQVGVPKHIQSWQSDTELPHNLFDEDFDENTVDLPESRPESVRTAATYTISKARIMSVFGRISDLAYSRKPTSYQEVLELDRKLEEAHEAMASSLRMKPLHQSITDASAVIMKRFTLDILYQKARIVLHRKYLTEAHQDSRLNYSRWVCVNAAKETLRHQHDLFHESQVGGRLYSDRWFFTSLQNHDFVLAAMVICLELSKKTEADVKSHQQGYGFSIVLDGRDEMLDALEKSRNIWQTNLRHSVEARKAFDALTIMLKKAKMDAELERNSQGQEQIGGLLTGGGGGHRTTNDDIAMGESASSIGFASADSREQPSETNLGAGVMIPTPPVSDSSNTIATNGLQQTSIDPSIQPAAAMLPQGPPLPDMDSSANTLDVIQSMIDAPNSLDWHIWDGHMQDFDPGMVDTIWNTNINLSNATVSGNGNGNGAQQIREENRDDLWFTTGTRG